MHGTQQLSKPVEGLKLPADPHKIQPLQPEARPAVAVRAAGRKEERQKQTNISYNGSLFVWLRYFSHNSQQSMQHAGERRDSYSTSNANTDVVVKHFLRRTSKGTVHVEPEHAAWTKTQQTISLETGQICTRIFILSLRVNPS